MNARTKTRLIAAVALPFLVANVDQASATRPVAVGAARMLRLPHISVEERGRPGAPAVILIPGLSTPAEVWAGVVPALVKDHRVILVQVNGFGGDAPGDNLKPGLLDGVVADLDGYLRENRLEPAAVIGHSMGGLVGLMLASKRPAAVSRLMVVDALPWIWLAFGPNQTPEGVQGVSKLTYDRIVARYGKPVDEEANTRTAATLALTDAAQARVRRWMAIADPRVTAQAAFEDMNTDLRPAVPRLFMPITVVVPSWAAGVRAEMEAPYRKAYAKVPHLTFVSIADSAHFVMLDQPTAFTTAVVAFLK